MVPRPASGAPTRSSSLLQPVALLKKLTAQHPGRWSAIRAQIKYLKSANVVLHASAGSSPGAAVRRSRVTGVPVVGKLPNHPLFAQLAQQETASPFTHLRFNTVAHGKLLAFNSGNVIRAGKHTHGDAYQAVLAFSRWCRKLHPHLHGMWPSAISMPNSVWSAQYTANIPHAVKHHSQATYSDRFPGISISLDRGELTSKITPELFLKDSKWILPGVRDIASLYAAAGQMATLASSVSAGSAPQPATGPA